MIRRRTLQAEQVSKIAESSTFEEVASSVEGSKGGGKEEVLAAHVRITELLQQGASVDGAAPAFAALEEKTLRCIDGLVIEEAMTILAAYTASGWAPEGALRDRLEAKLQQVGQ